MVVVVKEVVVVVKEVVVVVKEVVVVVLALLLRAWVTMGTEAECGGSSLPGPLVAKGLAHSVGPM